jgi:Xaa-Pro aminopeptidase
MPDRPQIPAARYAERLRRVAQLAGEAGLDALLVGVGADLRYLAGYDAMALERLTMLVVPAGKREGATLIAPRLEAARARACLAVGADLVRLVTFEETEDPFAVVAAGFAGRRAVAVSDRLWASFVLGLEGALPGVRFTLGSTVLRQLRMVKDADEIELLALAAAAADRVVLAIAAGRLVGRTEIDVSREIRERLVAEGHDAAAFAIVGSGPNSASPHHEASEREIGPGEPVVLDIGGTLGGYGSDVTRTLWVTGGDDRQGPDEGFRWLYRVLQDAQDRAVSAVREGVSAEAVDAAARDAIAAEGFGPSFIHRTGHGIGLEEHEEPYIVAGNAQTLRSGMVFSVEPGIYTEGRFGARIEDIVVCRRDGADVLNQVSRDLLVVAG